MKQADFVSGNERPLYHNKLVDPGTLLSATGGSSGLRYVLDEERRLWCPAVMLVSPVASGNVEIAGVTNLTDAGPQYAGVISAAYVHMLCSDSLLRLLRSAAALDGLASSPSDLALGEHHILIADRTPNASGPNTTNIASKGLIHTYFVGAANTVLQEAWDLKDLRTTMSIYAVASAGTFTLTVEVSSDNSNWITVDSAAAAATQTKQYDATHLAATIAVNVLSWRYVRVTCGAAGVGNTVTLMVGIK